MLIDTQIRFVNEPNKMFIGYNVSSNHYVRKTLDQKQNPKPAINK